MKSAKLTYAKATVGESRLCNLQWTASTEACFGERRWSWAGVLLACPFGTSLVNPFWVIHQPKPILTIFFIMYTPFQKASFLSVVPIIKNPAVAGLVWVGGAGRVRTAVQTRNQNVFYMLILLLIVGSRPAAGSLSEP